MSTECERKEEAFPLLFLPAYLPPSLSYFSYFSGTIPTSAVSWGGRHQTFQTPRRLGQHSVQAPSQNEFFFAKFNNNIKNIPLEDDSLHASYKKTETNISCAMIPLPELTRQEGVLYLPIQIYLSMGDTFQLVFKYIKNRYPNSNGAH